MDAATFVLFAAVLLVWPPHSSTHSTALDPSYLFTDVLPNLESELVQRFNATMEGELTDELARTVDKRLDEYFEMVRRSSGVDRARHSKRSLASGSPYQLLKDTKGVYRFKGITEYSKIPTQYPVDLVLFQYEGHTYAAALESYSSDYSEQLVLYRFAKRHGFSAIDRVPTNRGLAVDARQIDGKLYLVVAEGDGDTNGGGSGVYTINEGRLVHEQTLSTFKASDVKFWDLPGRHFLAVASAAYSPNIDRALETDVKILEWSDKHFDVVQSIPTTAAGSISVVEDNSTVFLAIAKYMDQTGNTDIDSEIWKYSLQDKRFVLHRRIRTHAATFVKFFSINQQIFLAVANNFELNADGTPNILTSSVIYKLSDGDFVPFQSFVLEAPSRWEAYSGPKGEFVLFAVLYYGGLKALQFNGWRFEEVPIETAAYLPNNVASVRVFSWEKNVLLTVASRQNPGNQPNVLKLEFSHENPVERLRGDNFQWCQRNLNTLENDDLERVAQATDAAPKWDSPLIAVNADVEFHGSSNVNSLAAGALKSNRISMDSQYLQTITRLQALLNRQSADVDEVVKKANAAVRVDGTNLLGAHLVANELSAAAGTNGCSLSSTKADYLNGELLDAFLDNIIRLDAAADIQKPLRFSSATVEGDLQSQYVAGQPSASLVNRVTTKALHRPLVATSQVSTPSLAASIVDGVPFNKEELLLLEGNQNLKHPLKGSAVYVGDLAVSGKLNGFQLDVHSRLKPQGPEWTVPQELSTLGVTYLEVDNVFGATRIDRLVANALKTSQSYQELSGDYTFDAISAYNVNATTLSAVAIQDIVDISEPSVAISGKFSSAVPVSASFLEVTQRLGGIPVKNNQLQVLSAKGTTETNSVPGTVTINRLTITESVNIKGTILGLDSSAKPQRPPIIQFDQPFDIQGDVTVNSLVDIAALKANDFVDSTGRLSLKETLQNGLRLDNPHLLPNMVFEGNLKVGKLISERINEVEASYWIPDRLPEVRLTAGKTFSQGLSISGSSSVIGLVSGVNLTSLDAEAVKVDGYQIITGHKMVDAVTAGRAWSNDSRLGDIRWQDVLLTSGGQHIPGVSRVRGSMIVKGGVASSTLKVKGTIGGVTLSQLLDDTVFKDDKSYLISAPKAFVREIEVGSLVLEKEADAGTRLLPTLPPVENEEPIRRNLNIRQPISVRNIKYEGTLDGVEPNAWDNWLLTTGDQVVLGALTIQGYVVAEAGLTVGNGYINRVNMTRLLFDAVRTDMPADLGHVKFEGGLRSYYPVSLGGLLNGLNISNALLLEPEPGLFEQTIVAPWSIGSLTVSRTFNPVGLVAGENLQDLCDFAYQSQVSTPENLHVKGSLATKAEPFVSSINGQSLTDIFNRIWLVDMVSEILRPVSFKKPLRLKGNSHTLDTVDGVKLASLSENYFSLTKDVSILTPIDFKAGLLAPNARLGSLKVVGRVNGRDLTKFAESVLRHDLFQEISGQFTFDGFHTSHDIAIIETLNGYDLDKDLMRLDKENVMTRPIAVLQDVSAVRLDMKGTVGLHGVDLEMWFQKAVRKSGDFTIRGKKTLRNTEMVGGVSVSNLVNGVPFTTDHLLTTTGEQTVTGRKTLKSSSPIVVADLELDGKLNGVLIGEYLRRSAKKNGDVALTGPLAFSAESLPTNTPLLHVHAANIANLYHGVNVSELVLKAGAPVELEEFRRASENLLRAAIRAVASLKSHAFYLSTFHLSATFDDAKCVFPLTLYNNPVAQLAVVQSFNGLDVIRRFIYDDSHETILPLAQGNDTLPSSVYLMRPILWRGYNAFYWEIVESKIPGTGTYVGFIIALKSDGGLALGAEVVRSAKKAEWVNSFDLDGRPCLMRGSHRYAAHAELFCAKSQIGFEFVQTLDLPSPSQVAQLKVDGDDHVLVTCASDGYTEGTVAVLRWDPHAEQLRLAQTFPVLNATAVDAITYSGAHFVAVASGRLDMKPHPGMVDISRYNPSLRSYAHWLSLEVESPIQVKFAVLPSDELALYVLTEQPTRSLVIFLYKGLAGFQEHAFAAVPLGDTLNVMQTLGYRHLVSVSSTHGGKAAILRANFKGVKYNSNPTASLRRRRRTTNAIR